jgi:uncharacterized protein
VYKKKPKSSRLIKAYIFSISICTSLLLILFLIDSPPGIDDDSEDNDFISSEEGYPADEPEVDVPVVGDQIISTTPKELYLVIDDTGYNLEQLKSYLDFPGMLTISILPKLQYSRESVALTIESGKDYILHQPMEALHGENPGPGVIKNGMSNDQIVSVLTENIQTVPGIKGMNNHMGSKATAYVEVMNSLMDYLNRNNLFFLDSYTTTDSIAAKTAEKYGVVFYKRDIFLDNSNEKDKILEEIEKGLKIADSKGMAILIGHVWSPVLIEVLQEQYEAILDNGYTFKGLLELYSTEADKRN